MKFTAAIVKICNVPIPILLWGNCPPLSRPCLCFTHFCHICTLIFYLPSIKSTIFHAKKSFHNDQLCIFYTRMEHWLGGGASQVGDMVAKRGHHPPPPPCYPTAFDWDDAYRSPPVNILCLGIEPRTSPGKANPPLLVIKCQNINNNHI